MLTLTTSRSSGGMTMLSGPVGLSGDECTDDSRRSLVGLGVDVAAEPLFPLFLLRAMLGVGSRCWALLGMTAK